MRYRKNRHPESRAGCSRLPRAGLLDLQETHDGQAHSQHQQWPGDRVITALEESCIRKLLAEVLQSHQTRDQKNLRDHHEEGDDHQMVELVWIHGIRVVVSRDLRCTPEDTRRQIRLWSIGEGESPRQMIGSPRGAERRGLPGQPPRGDG